MKPENQVTSLKYSQKLKELGVEQESLSWWCLLGIDYTVEKAGKPIWSLCGRKGEGEGRGACSAFTVAELGEYVAPVLEKNGHDFPDELLPDPAHKIFNADYWAKVLIYILENKLI